MQRQISAHRRENRSIQVKVDLEHLKSDTDPDVAAASIAQDILRELGK